MYKVIIVDDDFQTMMRIKKVITEECRDFEVAGFSSRIDEGMRLVEEKDPELVIMNVKWLISRAPFASGCTSIAIIDVYQEIDYFRSIFQAENVKCVIGKPIRSQEVQDAIYKVSLVIQSQHFIRYQQEFNKSIENILASIMEERIIEIMPEVSNCLSFLKKETTNLLEYSKEIYRSICLIHNLMVQKGIANYNEITPPTYSQLTLSGRLSEVDDIVIGYFDSVIDLLLKSESNYHPIIHKILLLISKDFHKPLTLETLGAQFYLNGAYLCQLFRKEVGISFVEYLTNVRLEKAKLLLEEGESIASVGEKVGYSNYRYFSQVFKKKIGMTPSKYREHLCRMKKEKMSG